MRKLKRRTVGSMGQRLRYIGTMHGYAAYRRLNGPIWLAFSCGGMLPGEARMPRG